MKLKLVSRWGHQAVSLLAVMLTVAVGSSHVAAQDATFSVKSLTPEVALTAAKAALEQCRKDGYQVAVAVVIARGTFRCCCATDSLAHIRSTSHRTKRGRRRVFVSQPPPSPLKRRPGNP